MRPAFHMNVNHSEKTADIADLVLNEGEAADRGLLAFNAFVIQPVIHIFVSFE